MEGEIICLDTSVLIDYFRKKEKAKSLFYKLTALDYEFVTTSITIFEIYRGMREEQSLFWQNLFQQIRVAPFDNKSSHIAAELSQSFQSTNKLIALPDLFIASICLRNNFKLATLNLKDFERIKSLEILTE